MPSSTMRLFVDALSQSPFSGSCSVVTHLLRHTFEGKGLSCEERLVRAPSIDAAGKLVEAERVRVTAAGDAQDLFFEEVFLRADFERPEDRARALVFFNLMSFDDETVNGYAGVRALLFNSEFLRRVFLSYVTDPRRPERIDAFAQTAIAACPLVPPPLLFPDGYESVGSPLDDADIDALTRASPLGHALRPGLSPLAAVAIMDGLRSATAGGAPRLVVLASQMGTLREVAERLGVSEPDALFVPVQRIDNPSLLRLMQSSDFGLAYDVSIEAYGFYALESVLAGCPLYTNGAGNLRHLLPPDHGIHQHETVAMTAGDTETILAAYRTVAENIAADLDSGDGRRRCQAGQAEIRKRYAVASFERALDDALRARPHAHRPTARTRFEAHPLLRTVDLASGRIITDEAPMTLQGPMLDTLSGVLEGGRAEPSPQRDVLLAHHVITPSVEPS